MQNAVEVVSVTDDDTDFVGTVDVVVDAVKIVSVTATEEDVDVIDVVVEHEACCGSCNNCESCDNDW